MEPVVRIIDNELTRSKKLAGRLAYLLSRGDQVRLAIIPKTDRACGTMATRLLPESCIEPYEGEIKLKATPEGSIHHLNRGSR